MKFADLVRSKGYTAKQLADAAGISIRTLEAYYSGKRSIKRCRADLFISFSKILGISPDELLSLED